MGRTRIEEMFRRLPCSHPAAALYLYGRERLVEGGRTGAPASRQSPASPGVVAVARGCGGVDRMRISQVLEPDCNVRGLAGSSLRR